MAPVTIQRAVEVRSENSPSASDLRRIHYCSGCGDPLIAEPVLVCAQCGRQTRLRCFSYRKGKHFIAECIDLDVMADGDTQEEAIGGLQEAVYGYLNAALDGDTTGLIPRPAPLSHRIHYYVQLIVDKVKVLFDRKHQASTADCYYEFRDTRTSHC